MSRAVRRVPASWEHPRDDRGRYRPMHDRNFAVEAAEWSGCCPTCHSAFVGVKPEDGRDTLWLDGPALYRCHSQTVQLEFVPFIGES